ncbi:MAG TPA: carboxypeptidase-like regulatory domain-containing protein, partial [Chitinophagaceae bacterium]|nr:carboxypeptidase-like regulatory domain-containing protein [Chitinophagaceae bacterium]
MKKSTNFFIATTVAVLLSFTSLCQSITISGTVKDTETGLNIPAVSVIVRGTGQGTFTDEHGNFTVVTSRSPVTLIFSSVGYETKEQVVSNTSSSLEIQLSTGSSLGQEVVVSASRVPERLFESPVTAERISSVAIRNAPAAMYYDILGNVKGVDLTTSSLTFKTPSTRGFNGSGNLRFNQLIDGMDNQAPGLNFSMGSIIGITELDVESMELLPGA